MLVYDLGGGTFDVTLARVSAEGITVIATDGNHELGGKNAGDPFDKIGRLLGKQAGLRYAIVLADGVWEHQPAAIKRARRCHQAGVQIVAVGFGGADRRFLEQISSSSAQSFFTDLNGLADTFGSIAREIGAGGIVKV